QVGLQRISHVAHSAEDLIGRVRDGEIKPTQQVIDLCLETVDVIKKFIYRQWSDEATLQTSVKSLLGRMKEIAAAGEVTSADLSEAGLDSEVSADRVTTSVSIVSESAVKPRMPESAKPQLADVDTDAEPEFITGLRTLGSAGLPPSQSSTLRL